MTTTLDLTRRQTAYARGIIAACRARPRPGDQCQRLADIALAAALTESGLRMYANANNPRSLQLPHDAVGCDHGSVGLFQQQVGGAVNSTANWGTTEQLMNAEISTRKFLNALLGTDWTATTNWMAAQQVQHSAFPDGSNYRSNDARAIAIRKALWDERTERDERIDRGEQHAHRGGVGVSRVHVVAKNETLFSIAQAWGVTLTQVKAANPRAGHPAGNFGAIEPGDRIVHP